MTDFSLEVEQIRQVIWEAVAAITAPHALMRVRVYPDGSMWCALHGENLQEGVAGFGETPAAACADFDKNWNAQKLQRAVASSNPLSEQDRRGKK